MLPRKRWKETLDRTRSKPDVEKRVCFGLEMLAWSSGLAQLWGNQRQLTQTWPEKKSDHRNDLTNPISYSDELNKLRQEQPLSRVTGKLRRGTGTGISDPAADVLPGHG